MVSARDSRGDTWVRPLPRWRRDGSYTGGMDESSTARDVIAVGIIIDDAGRVLLQLRDEKAGLAGAGQWGFFGGHLEGDEAPSAAFMREMQEELEWRPRHFERYTTREVDGDGWHVTSHVFAAHLDVPLVGLVQTEGQALDVFALDALPPNVVPSVQPVLEEFATSDAYKRVRRAWAHLTTTGLLVDRDGRFLLQHRDDFDYIANPGMWGSFGGEIEPYEPPDESFLREMQEELSWQPSRFELYATFPYRRGPPHNDARAMQLIYVYMALVDVPESALVLGEGQGFGFFAPDALPEKIVPELRGLIERFAATAEYAALCGNASA